MNIWIVAGLFAVVGLFILFFKSVGENVAVKVEKKIFPEEPKEGKK
jgi:hypothetical protein